jgi:protein-tyrosine phosphatase
VAEAGLAACFEIDSAGTAGYHSGEAPDQRARAAGKRAGIVVAGAARQFHADDFARFDHVLAMDTSNLNDLRRLAPSADGAARVRLLRSYDPDAPKDAPVPDPYYGDDAGFDHVLELCRVACRSLLEEIRREQRL